MKMISEMSELAKRAEDAGIPVGIRECNGGCQLYYIENEIKLDFVHHYFSYGNKENLLEGMNKYLRNGDDGVEGYLTVDDAFERLKDYHELKVRNATYEEIQIFFEEKYLDEDVEYYEEYDEEDYEALEEDEED